MKIRTLTRKGLKTVAFESETLFVALIPELGAKIISLRHKPTGFEFMYQGRRKRWRLARWGDAYTDHDPCGWDEMMPTINECFYPDGPWKGRLLTDHGEIWPRPWTIENRPGSILCSVYGHALPYRFEREMSFAAANVLRLQYRIHSLADEPFYFLWSAHPLCNCNARTEILLPDAVRHVLNAVPNCKLLGDYRQPHAWPVTGLGHDLRRVAPRSANRFKKWFVRGKMPADRHGQTWCGLSYPDHKLKLLWKYPAAQVPYYGLWVSEGGFDHHYHVAPEPCTAMIDRVDSAIYTDTVSKLAPHATWAWTMDVRVESLR